MLRLSNSLPQRVGERRRHRPTASATSAPARCDTQPPWRAAAPSPGSVLLAGVGLAMDAKGILAGATTAFEEDLEEGEIPAVGEFGGGGMSASSSASDSSPLRGPRPSSSTPAVGDPKAREENRASPTRSTCSTSGRSERDAAQKAGEEDADRDIGGQTKEGSAETASCNRLSQLKQEHAAEVGQLLSQSKQEQASSAKDESKMAQTTTTTPLHNFHEIIAQEEQEGSPSQLKDRVMNDEVICLAGKTKKYWVHREIRCNCFILLPRALSITWGDNTEYWRWELMPAGESSDHSETMEVASLLMVCWLEIHGKLELSHLTPDVNYKVVFEVKLAEKSYGWARPVNLRLKFPDGPVDGAQGRGDPAEEGPEGGDQDLPL